jgi:tetratricopeptide (TPR) repeat protein
VRKVLLAVAVCVLSLPLIFVLWLLMAVRSPKLDAITMQMPDSVRSTVADAAMENVKAGKGWLPGIKRVIALDPHNVKAWDDLCDWESDNEGGEGGVKDCRTALSLHDSAPNWDNLGELQEDAGDDCAAADSYTKASSLGSSGTYYAYVEHLGRASLRCGKNYDARAGLAAAIDLEDKSLKEDDNDDDDIADYKADQLADREYLIVTLDRLHDTAGAKAVCSAAHPDWKSCVCKLDDKDEVACVDGK